MFVNKLASVKRVPNFPKKVISANTDDDAEVQQALTNWVTFTTESEVLESLETTTLYISEDFELFDFVLLDAFADGYDNTDHEGMITFKAAITKW
jgi:hypothetical protein